MAVFRNFKRILISAFFALFALFVSTGANAAIDTCLGQTNEGFYCRLTIRHNCVPGCYCPGTPYMNSSATNDDGIISCCAATSGEYSPENFENQNCGGGALKCPAKYPNSESGAIKTDCYVELEAGKCVVTKGEGLVTCPAGYECFNTSGKIYFDTSKNYVSGHYTTGGCYKCQKGYYSQPGQTDCTKCPAGTTTASNATAYAGSVDETCQTCSNADGVEEWDDEDEDGSSPCIIKTCKYGYSLSNSECVGIAKTVTLNSNGGSGGTSSVYARYGSAMPSISRPSRPGFVFSGYYDAVNGGTQYYTASGESARNWDKTESGIILYAHWTECAAGYYCPGDNTSTKCAIGSFSAAGAMECLTCLDGKTTSTTGATSCDTNCPNYEETYSYGSYYYYWKIPQWHNNVVTDLCEYTPCDTGYYAKKYYLASIIDTSASMSGEAQITNDYTIRSGSPSDYGISDRNSFALKYNDNLGVITGHARCSQQGGTGITSRYTDPDSVSKTDNLTEDFRNGQYCWCQIDGYIPYGKSRQYVPAPWVFLADYGSGSACSNSCLSQCVGYLRATSGEMFLLKRESIIRSAVRSPIYGVCEIETYSIHFDKNADDAVAGTTYVSGITYNSTLPSDITVPTRDGYVFVGYYDTKNSTGGVKYYDNTGNPLRNWDKSYTGWLYARWEPLQYTVSFNANGGTGGQSQDVIATSGSPMPAISTTAPTRQYYLFGGWYDTSDSTGGTQYYTASGESARNFDKASDTTLYARWIQRIYTITYKDGSTTMTGLTPTSYDIEGDAITLPTPTKTGYTFYGWCDDENLTQNCATERTIPSGSTGDKTFYAKFKANTYLIVLNGSVNGCDTYCGSTSISEVYNTKWLSFNGQQTITTSPLNPNKNNATFTGWYDSVTGGNFKFGATLPEPNMFVEDTTLYAHFECNTDYVLNNETGRCILENQNIIYNMNGGTNYNGAPTTYKYGIGAIIDGTPTKDNYTFAGWCTDSGLTNCAATQTISTTDYGDKTFWAKWIGNAYTVTLDKNADDAVAGTTSVRATYGSAMPTPITLPTRDRYVFIGYYDTAESTGGTQYYDASGLSVRVWNKAADTTLYARWEHSTYTITLSRNGVTRNIKEVYSEKWTDSDGNTITLAPSDSEYSYSQKVFLGYFDNNGSSGGTKYIDEYLTLPANTTFTSDTTLYARWQDCTCSNGIHSECILGYSAHEENVCRYSYACRTGYSNNGLKSGNLVGPYGVANVSASDCLTPDTYTITLDDTTNGGSGGSGTVKEVYGEKWTDSDGNTITSVATPTKTNSVFTGYFGSSSGGTKYISTDMLLPSTTAFSASATVYAQFGQCTCYFRYNKANVSSCAVDGVNNQNQCVYSYTCFDNYNTDGNNDNKTGTFIGDNGIYDNTVPNCLPNTYIITLDDATNGGSGGVGTIKLVYATGYTDMDGNTITSVTAPNKTGGIFYGYYNGGSKQIDADGTITVGNTGFTSDTTLYARFGNCACTAGTGVESCESIKSSDPTRCNYRYTCKNAYTTDGTNTSDTFMGGVNVRTSTSPDCIPNEYTITLDNANATTNGTSTLYTKYNTGLYLDSDRTKSMSYNSNAITKPSRTGATVSYNGNGGTVGSLNSNHTSARDYSFLGYYSEPGDIQYVYGSDGVTTITPPGTQYITDGGYRTSDGYYAAKSYTSNDNVWHARWKPGRVILPTSTYITRTGYTFTGWYDAPNGGVCIGRGLSGTVCGNTTQYYYPSSNTTLYAHWLPYTYKITLDNSNATTNGTAELWYQYEQTEPCTYYSADSSVEENRITANCLPTITIPQRTGYNFAGYTYGGTQYIDGSGRYTYGGTQYIDGSGNFVNNLYKTTGNKTLYANWSVINYPITYYIDGVEDDSFAGYTTYTIATFTTLPSPTKTGYTFSGWHTEPDYSDDVVTQIPAGSTGPKTFYAEWTPIDYTIKYFERYSTEISGLTPTSYNVETETFDLPTYSKPGFEFGGWYDDSSLSGDPITQIEKGSRTGNLNLYVKWLQLTCEPGYYLRANDNYCSECDSEGYCPGIGPVAPSNEDQGLKLCSALTDNSKEGAFGLEAENQPGFVGKEVADSPETCMANLLYGTETGMSFFSGGQEPMPNYNPNLPVNTNNTFLYQTCLYNTTTHAYTDCLPLLKASGGVYCKNGYIVPQSYIDNVQTIQQNVSNIGDDPEQFAAFVRQIVGEPFVCSPAGYNWYTNMYDAIVDNAESDPYGYMSFFANNVGMIFEGGEIRHITENATLSDVYKQCPVSFPHTATNTSWKKAQCFANVHFDTNGGNAVDDIEMHHQGSDSGYKMCNMLINVVDLTASPESAAIKRQDGTTCTAVDLSADSSNTIEDCNDPVFTDMSAGDWKLGFSYGTVSGKTLCSATTAANQFDIGAPNTESGGNCWCKVSAFTDTNNATTDITDGQWVFMDAFSTDTAVADCQSRCAEICPSQIVYGSANVVSKLYSNICLSDSATTPIRDGYTFAGWYTETNDKVDKDTILSGDQTLYAKWNMACDACSAGSGVQNCVMNATENSCSYSATCADGYSRNGGSDTNTEAICTGSTCSCNPRTYIITYKDGSTTLTGLTPTTYTYGIGATIDGTPSKDGYTFAGWCTDSELTNCDTTQTISTTDIGDKTYWAKWDANTYTITYKDGSTILTGLTPTSYTYGVGATIDGTLTKDNYTFIGWCTDETLQDCAATQTISATDIGDKTYWAKYDADTYTITYKDGSTTLTGLTPTTYAYGTGATIDGIPTKPGYVFAGWCTDSELTDCAATQTISATDVGDKEYWVQWDIECPDGFKDGTGVKDLNMCYRNGTTTCTEYLSFTNAQVSYAVSNASLPCKQYYGSDTCVPDNVGACDVTDYTCGDNYDDTPWNIDSSVMPNAFAIIRTQNATCYRIDADNNVTEDCADSAFNDIEPGDWKWEYADKTIYGVGRCSDTVGTNFVVGNPDFTNTGEYCWCRIEKINNETAVSAWVNVQVPQCDANCVNICGFAPFFSSEYVDIITNTLTKQCVAKTYNIAYNMGGGTNYNGAPTTYTYGTGATIDGTPTKDNYTFVGWCTDSELTNCAVTQTISTTDSGDKTFWAKWIGNAYTVTLDKNADDATAGTTSVTAIYDADMPEITLPTRTGYTFDGFYDAQTGGTQYYGKTLCGTGNNVNICGACYTSEHVWDKTQNTTLYAHWTPRTTSKSLDHNGGTNTISTLYAKYDTGISTSSDYTNIMTTSANPMPIPTRNGYVFDGYYPASITHVGSRGDDDGTDLVYNFTDTQIIDANGYITSDGISYFNDEMTVCSAVASLHVIAAKWTPATYTITYNLNGGTNYSGAPTTYMYGTGATIDGTPTKDGYTFVGWCTDETLQDCAATQTISTTDIGDKTYWAKWEANTYTITYKDGSTTLTGLTPTTYTYGIGATIDGTPTKDGYTFAGWCTDSELTNCDITQTISTTDIGDKEYWAKWNVITYDITYHSNGGTEYTTGHYTIESDDITLPEPIKEGYGFAGWYDNSELTGTAITTIPHGSTGNREYWAKWGIMTYTITYENLYDGVLPDNPPTEFTVESDDISIPEPTRIGYTFIGWCDDELLTQNCAMGRTVPHGSTGNKTFYANWQENTYLVRFVPNSPYVENASAMTNYLVQEYGTEYMECLYDHECTLPKNLYTNPGFEFMGWKKADDNHVYADESFIIKQTEDVVLLAQWDNATIHCDPGWFLPKQTYDDCVICPQKYFCSGGDFEFSFSLHQGIEYCGTYMNESLVTTDGEGATNLYDCYVLCDSTKGNYVIDPEYNKITYSQDADSVCKYKAEVVYGDENCDTLTYYSTNTTIDLCVPDAKPGKTFTGWIDNKGNQYNVSDNPNLTNITIADSVPTNGVVTMTPNWIVEQYMITYQCGNEKTILAENLEYGDNVDLLNYEHCNNTGFTLQNWECKDSNNHNVFVDNYTMPASDVTCVANAVANSYVVNFDVNGGVGGQSESLTFEYGDVLEPLGTTSAPTREGYDFVGWFDANGILYYDPYGVNVLQNWIFTKDTTLYANWLPTEYTISYTIPYGITASNVSSYTIETPTFTLNNPSKSGYEFIAWCENEELTENCETTKTIEQGSSGDKEFFADMKEIIYTVTYKYTDTNGEEHDISYLFDDNYTKRTLKQSITYPTNVNIPGYKFIKWYSNSALSGSPVTGVASYVKSNKEVWAKTEPLTCDVNQYMTESGVCNACPDHSTSNGGTITECDCDNGYVKSDDVCVAKIYNIEYEYNGALAVSNPTQYTVETEPITLNEPSKDNYIFTGWYLYSDLSGNQITTISGDLSGDITLYAGWVYAPCPVNHYLQDDSCLPCPLHSSSNGAYATSCVCDKYYESDENNGCVLQNYTIDYVLDGGVLQSGQTNPGQYNIDTTTTQLYNPIKDGYTFVEWRLNGINGDVLTDISGALADYGDITLYAKWNKDPDSSTLTFKCSDDENIDIKDYVGTSVSLPTTSDCNISVGKITKWKCGTQTYTVPGTINIPATNTTCTPTISYSDVVYNLEYKGYDTDGNEIDVSDINPKTYVSKNGVTFPTRTTVSVPGYNFNGWYLSYENSRFSSSITGLARYATGNKTLYGKFTPATYNCDPGTYLPANSTECIPCDEANAYCPGGDLIYSDTDSGKKYCVDPYPYSDITNEGVASQNDCYRYCEERDYYTVIGYKYFDGSNNCEYTPITYYIHYDTNGGNAIIPQAFTVETGTIINLPSPYRSDKLFDGWFDENGRYVDSIDTSFGRDITLYAQWTEKPCDGNQYKLDGVCVACPAHSHGAADGISECECDTGYEKIAASCEPIEYNITYIGLEGASNIFNPLKYTVENAGEALVAPSNRIGYEFDGWTKDGVVFNAIPYGVTGDITLTANWHTKTVHCDPGEYLPANSETCTPCTEENVYCQGGDIEYSDSTNGKKMCPSAYPYSVAGATTVNQCYKTCVDPNVDGAIYSDGTDTCDYTYPIEYVLNGGEFVADYPQSYEHGIGALVLAIPHKSGYVFGGWYDNAEMSGLAVRDISTNIYGKITLYAKWEFGCESGKWLHIGSDDKICMYESKPELPAMVIETKNGTYYMMLSENSDTPIHENSNKKLRVEIDGRVYNAHDASVIVE